MKAKEKSRKLKLNLLTKTEIRIENIELQNVNLNQIAAVIADVLGLDYHEVMVTDAEKNHITVDILRKWIYAENIFGKKKELFRRLSEIPGVTIKESTSIHSDGVLGFIDLDEEETKQLIERTKKIRDEIKKRILKRAIVFPTGHEVKNGVIEDANTPMIIKRLEKEGYKVTRGPVLDDDEYDVFRNILRAVHQGYGLIVTTGGVGAEEKDRTIEGILRVDSKASTPYITRYEKGSHRHVKDGVRIAVGKVGETTIIGLPGPNEEVKIGLEAAIDAIKRGADKQAIANAIAKALRKNLRAITKE